MRCCSRAVWWRSSPRGSATTSRRGSRSAPARRASRSRRWVRAGCVASTPSPWGSPTTPRRGSVRVPSSGSARPWRWRAGPRRTAASPRATVRAVTEELEGQLDRVSPSYESWEQAERLARLAAVVVRTPAADGSPDARPPEAGLAGRVAVAARLAALQEESPGSLRELSDACAAYERDLAVLGVDDAQLAASGRRRVQLSMVGGMLTVVLALPFAAVGIVVHLVPFSIVKQVARRPTNEGIKATVKLLGCVVLFALTYAVIGVFAGRAYGTWAGLLAAVVAPLCGYTTVRLRERLQRMGGVVEGIGRAGVAAGTSCAHCWPSARHSWARRGPCCSREARGGPLRARPGAGGRGLAASRRGNGGRAGRRPGARRLLAPAVRQTADASARPRRDRAGVDGLQHRVPAGGPVQSRRVAPDLPGRVRCDRPPGADRRGGPDVGGHVRPFGGRAPGALGRLGARRRCGATAARGGRREGGRVVGRGGRPRGRRAGGVGRGAVEALMGAGPDEEAERYRLASPAALLPLGKPQLLLHGLADDSVPPSLSEHYTARARWAWATPPCTSPCPASGTWRSSAGAAPPSPRWPRGCGVCSAPPPQGAERHHRSASSQVGQARSGPGRGRSGALRGSSCGPVVSIPGVERNGRRGGMTLAPHDAADLPAVGDGTEPESGASSRARQWLHPTKLGYLIGPVAFAIILLLMRFGYVARAKWWVWLGLFSAPSRSSTRRPTSSTSAIPAGCRSICASSARSPR